MIDAHKLLIGSAAMVVSMAAITPAIGQHDVGPAGGRSGASASNSVLAQALRERADQSSPGKEKHALRDSSLFVIPPPRPRQFAKHDLVQIIVRETSNAKSEQTLDTSKEYDIKGKIAKWPNLQLADLLELQIPGISSAVPELDLNFDKEFAGDGEYQRKDDLTARLTAEIIDILPNGNLILEARSHIKLDEETQTMKVTGICRPDDISVGNTVLSNQLHDLSIEKVHSGELKKSNEKGVIAQVLDALFAF